MIDFCYFVALLQIVKLHASSNTKMFYPSIRVILERSEGSIPESE